MTTEAVAEQEPLWLSIERRIGEKDSAAFSGDEGERTIQQISASLDQAGYNVSRHGGNMLELRRAVEDRANVGRALIKDFEAAVAALTLDNLAEPVEATLALVDDLGSDWPKLKGVEIRSDVLAIVNATKLDLQVEKARGLGEEKGIRYLLTEGVGEEAIMGRLDIAAEKLESVKAAIAAERAEIVRIEGLLEAVADQSDVDKAKHLIGHDVADTAIIEVAGLDQAAIDAARQAMEEELREKERQAAEEAARKKAEAEGPSLDAIPADEMLEHIEAIREIMEFSDQADEIRQMCEQSNIPKALVDIAVSDPAKLDELEATAQG